MQKPTIARTVIAPTPIPTPSPIAASKDSPLDGDVIEVGLIGEPEGVVVVIAIPVVEIEEMKVRLGFCLIAVPFTTKNPFPALQHDNAL
jgi:hypothetical protein